MFHNSLRVLLYHRVCDPDAPSFYGLKANVSATPENFGKQLDHLACHYSVIGLADCLAWVEGRRTLPRGALLITFDDGYRDNFTTALPLLAARGMPFVLFVTTGCVGDRQAFFWDQVGEAFRHVDRRCGDLPLLGRTDWSANPDSVAERWVRAATRVPHAKRESILDQLSRALARPRQSQPPSGTYVTWSDLKSMQYQGGTIGAHTVTHPMTNTISVREFVREVLQSREEIESHLSQRVLSFSYPYGGPDEFDASMGRHLQSCGIRMAFRSTGGLNFARNARGDAFSLRRRSVSLNDSIEAFAAWSAGASRLFES
jgi:peptidoglycan/xylan/chitin deacetylase (PgdA/CDA1 family)